MLGARIRELRNKKGMTQKDLASLLGVTDAAIGMWENGRREPNAEHIKRMANIFCVTTDYLLGQESPQKQVIPTIAAKMPEGWDELTPEAQKDVEEFIKFVRQKYGKKSD
ncbi:MAG TPA: helix-turn-helix transcriptional regulator [Limnochordia bacterium]|nr:helix-turn-helix transcriptional regulator [Bacillota bacterium]HOB09789.1 helix-turn-helix transcriptional regulator [Limnochordia bacterium]